MTHCAKDTVSIFLVDDHPAVRQGLKLLLLEEGYIICGGATGGKEALQQNELCRADLVLLDLSLGEENGLAFIAELREQGTAVLVYSMYEDADTIEKAFAEGANGYVTKREGSDTLLQAVSDVLAGQRSISPRAAQSLANKVLSPSTAPCISLLSQREQQILTMLGQGDSTADIAVYFDISVRTVETYYTRIIDKLQLSGMKALRRHAIQNGQQQASSGMPVDSRNRRPT